MAQPSGEHIPTAVPVQATPVQAVPVQQTQGFTAPNYEGSGVSPELQVMDANKMPQAPPVVSAQAVTKVASGYEFLRGRRQFFIKQRFEKMEALAGAVGCGCIEYKNKYDVFDVQTKQPLLFVKEESDTFFRCCCKPHHRLTLNVYDVTQGNPNEIQPTMTVEKPFKLWCCTCCNICSQTQSAVLTSGNKPVGSAKKHVPCGGCFKPQVSARVFALEVYFDCNSMLYLADRSIGRKWTKRRPYQRPVLLCWRPD